MDDTTIPDPSSDPESDYPTWDIKRESDTTWLVSNIDLKGEDKDDKNLSKKSVDDPLGKYWRDHLSDILVANCLENSEAPMEVTRVLSCQRINHPEMFGYHMYCKVQTVPDGGRPLGYMFAEVNISRLSPTSIRMEVPFCKIVEQSSEYKKGGCRFCPSSVLHPIGMKTINLRGYPGFSPYSGSSCVSDDSDDEPLKERPVSQFESCSSDEEEEEE